MVLSVFEKNLKNTYNKELDGNAYAKYKSNGFVVNFYYSACSKVYRHDLKKVLYVKFVQGLVNKRQIK